VTPLKLRKKLEEFLKEVRLNKDRLFPTSKLMIIRERMNFLKLRLELKENVFIDIYFNAENGRKDFALISGGKRIFGYDNLKEWHQHPFDHPGNHVECEEPTMVKIFEEVASIIE
jgi:hypothetical protein